MDPEPIPTELSDPPVELMRQTPRRVKLTGLGWTNVFLSAFFLVAGVAIGVNFVQQAVRTITAQNMLRQGGSEASGQITGKWSLTGGKLAMWKVDYTFAVDGTLYSGESKVPKEIWKSLHENDSLRIRYLISNPNTNHPAGWEDMTPSDLWILVFPAGMAIFGLLFARRIPLQRRLALEGVGVRGCISDWHGPSRAGFVLDYTFRNLSSNGVEIGSCRSDQALKAGSEVWVLYLPSDPSRSEIYPFNAEFFRIE